MATALVVPRLKYKLASLAPVFFVYGGYVYANNLFLKVSCIFVAQNILEFAPWISVNIFAANTSLRLLKMSICYWQAYIVAFWGSSCSQ